MWTKCSTKSLNPLYSYEPNTAYPETLCPNTRGPAAWVSLGYMRALRTYGPAEILSLPFVDESGNVVVEIWYGTPSLSLSHTAPFCVCAHCNATL